MSHALDHLRQLLDERYAAVLKNLDALWAVLGGQEMAKKKRAAERLGESLKHLQDLIREKQTPRWLPVLRQQAERYAADQNNHAALAETLLSQTIHVREQTWELLTDPDWRPVDLDRLLEEASQGGKSNQYFQDLIDQVVKLVESKELQDEVLEAGLRILISLMKRQRTRPAGSKRAAVKCLWWFMEERAKVFLEESPNGQALVRTYDRYKAAAEKEVETAAKGLGRELNLDPKLLRSGEAILQADWLGAPKPPPSLPPGTVPSPSPPPVTNDGTGPF